MILKKIVIKKAITKPNHSAKSIRRMGNNGRAMSEQYHINHFIQRVEERFGIKITLNKYYSILEEIQKQHFLYKVNSSTYVYPIFIENKEVWVLYGKSSKDRVVRRLKTALIPHEMFLVPNCIHHVYDNATFTTQVKFVIKQIKEMAENLDMSDKAAFFKNKKLNQTLKSGIYQYKKGIWRGEYILVKYAVRYIVEQTLNNE